VVNKKIRQKKGIKIEVSTINKSKKLPFILFGAAIILLLLVILFVQISKPKIAVGDTVTLDYTGYLDNGTVFDTSIQEIGVQAGIKRQTYEPLIFTIGQGQIVIGFEEQVIGLGKEDKKRFTVAPDKAYGQFREEFIGGISRMLNFTKYSYISIDRYNQLSQDKPSVGSVLNVNYIPWDMKILDFNETIVKIENVMNVGQKLDLSNLFGIQWESVVIGVEDEFILIKQNPNIGDIMITPLQQGTRIARVINFNETSITLDSNHPLAGKTLTFEINIKEINKPEK